MDKIVIIKIIWAPTSLATDRVHDIFKKFEHFLKYRFPNN